jgi:hypothetical protein
VIAKWNTIYGDSKTKDLLALLTAKIDVLAAEIAQTRVDNYASTANGGAGWILEGDYSAAVQAIKDYLTERFEYLDTKFKELSANETVETVELIQGEPYTITANTTVKKIVYKRTFNKSQNHYQTWFVPFNYTITGNENADFYGINLISATSSPDGIITDNTKVYIFLEERNAGSVLYANRPYIIKAHQKDYEFVSESEEGVMLYAPTTESRLKMETSAFAYDFYGTYDTFYATKGYDWLSLSQKGEICWNATAAATLQSFRWYIKATPKTDDYDYSKITFIFAEEGEEGTTNITNISDSSAPESYYSPNGIQLEKPVKGLNIVKMKDGSTRKVIVK